MDKRIQLRNGNTGVSVKDVARLAAALDKRLDHRTLNRGFAAEIWGAEEPLVERDLEVVRNLGYEIF